MGRAVLLASEMPFKAVVGVELNATLTGIARRNAAVWRKAGRAHAPIRIVCGDAVEYKWPTGPCLAFLFNPFGETVMRRLVKSWKRSFAGRAGELDILYAVSYTHLDVYKRQTMRFDPARIACVASRPTLDRFDLTSAKDLLNQ